MFPTLQSARLPRLPDLYATANRATASELFSIGGGIGGIGGIFGGGGPSIGMPPIVIGGGSGGSGTGKVTSVGLPGMIAGGLSSILGLPAINWGRLAAFLLGLLLIAGGIYLIPSVQRTVNVTVKQAGKTLAETGAEA